MKQPQARRISLTRHKHSLWALPAFGLLLIAGVWTGTWVQLQSTERALIGAEIRDTESFVASFERYTRRQLKDADRTARLVKREFELHGNLDLSHLVDAGLSEDNLLVVVSVANAKGDIVASSQPLNSINISDHEYFRLHEARDTGLLDISKPITGSASGRQIIQLSRRMNGVDGSFAGVVVLSVTPTYFTGFSKEADPQNRRSLALLGLDGTFRVRVVDGLATTASDGRGIQLVARAEANPTGHYEARREIDNAVRIIAYRKLADYPLIVSAARAPDETLEEFYQNRISYLIIALAATLATLIFFGVVTVLAARLQRHRRDLKAQRQFLHTIVDNIPSGITVRSMQPGTAGQYMLWNESNSLIFGTNPEDALGKTARDVMPDRYAAEIADLDRQLLASPMVQDIVQVRDPPDGTRRIYHLVRAPIFGADGQVDSIMTSASDITAEQARTDELRLASKVFETTVDAIVISDADDRVVMVNAAFSKLTGYDAQAIEGRILDESPFRPLDLVEAADRDKRLDRDGFVAAEVPRVSKDGTPLSLWLTASCVRNADGSIRNYVRVFTDISLLKETQRKLEELASFDSLTGLPNRRLLHDRLEQALRRAQRSDKGLAVMFIDLDGFKNVNDTLGHAMGDLMLQEIGPRLQKCIRSSDSIGRLGGDEFAIVLEDTRNPPDIVQIADRIIAAFAPPFVLDGRPVATSASVGIAIYPNDGTDAATLLKSADIAMYRAKHAGRNQFNFFSERTEIEPAIG